MSCPASSRDPLLAGLLGVVRGDDDLTCFLVQSNQQRDSQSRCRKRDDNAGYHQRLRNRVGSKSGGRAPSGENTEQQKHAGAENVEGQNFSQDLGASDEAVQTEPHQNSSAVAKERG